MHLREKKSMDHFTTLLNNLTNSTYLPSNSRMNYKSARLRSLDTWCSKARLKNESIDKGSKPFRQYTQLMPSPRRKNGETTRILRTNSSKTTFEESLVKFKQSGRARGHPKTIIEWYLSRVNFVSRPSALTQKIKSLAEDLAYRPYISPSS